MRSACILALLLPCSAVEILEPEVPVRRITNGPAHHWFGYYDKLQFDPSERHVLGMKVGFEGRSPTAEDVVEIGVINLEEDDAWTRLGESRAWGWQQGCMLQWRPGSDSEVLWNDRDGDRFITRVKDIASGDERTLPDPVYTLSHDGKFALGTNFSRIQTMRPGYGYPGVPDPEAGSRAPESYGIHRVDLESGESETILTIAEVASVPQPGTQLSEKWHYFNHLLVSPDNSRFVFLHRWRENNDGDPSGGFTTRMFSADTEGSDLYLLDPSGNTSHFIWRNSEQLCMWTKPAGEPWGFYLLTDKTGETEPVAHEAMPRNGHNLYLPFGDGEWILNDTYPDKKRRQTLYIYHPPTDTKIILGRFHSPPEYKGEWRTDLHCRFSPSGRFLCFDSTHEGLGRQMYLIDLTEVPELVERGVFPDRQ